MHATVSCALWPLTGGPVGLGLYNDRETLVKKTGQGQQEANLGTTDRDTGCPWELAAQPS